jgi:hypothetical protein
MNKDKKELKKEDFGAFDIAFLKKDEYHLSHWYKCWVIGDRQSALSIAIGVLMIILSAILKTCL